MDHQKKTSCCKISIQTNGLYVLLISIDNIALQDYYVKWNDDDWSRVLFSDESRFASLDQMDDGELGEDLE